MRELSFVKKVKFEFIGSVTKRALVLGDADNDGHNELVCANLQGDLAIFKERNCNKFAYASDLGMITACIVGDVMNSRRNFVVAINMEGWLFIFEVTQTRMKCTYKTLESQGDDTKITDDDPSCSDNGLTGSHPKKLSLFYEQRMPANCKELLLADLDGDGQNELIIGLTDRVLRTYKWITIDNDRGKFVGLYKWELADQIGSVSLNPSRRKRCLDIIVAQPGGTYARLECFDKKPIFISSDLKTSASGNVGSQDQGKNLSLSLSSEEMQSPECQKSHEQNSLNSSNIDAGHDNVKTEYISKLTPEYHQLAIAQMRNPHISTEILGGLRIGKESDLSSSLVIATLDGTLMLVNKDEILWSLQVDHQLFALAVIEQNTKTGAHTIQANLPQSESACTIVASPECQLDQVITDSSKERSTSNDSPANDRLQYLVVCAWNGKTYIMDEERNYIRFKFDEAVSAFTAGTYYFDAEHHSALVYATFNNQIVLYYDVVSDNIKPSFLLDEIMNNPEHDNLREKLELLAEKLGYCGCDNDGAVHGTNKLYKLAHDILYALRDDEL